MLKGLRGGAHPGNTMPQRQKIPPDQVEIVRIVVNNEDEKGFSVVLKHRQTIGKSLPKLAISRTCRTLPLALARQTVFPELLALSRSINNMPRAELSR